MSKPAQQLVAAIVKDNRLTDDRAESGHAVGKPQRDAPAVQRQIGASCFAGHALSISFPVLPALPAPIHSRFGGLMDVVDVTRQYHRTPIFQ